MSGRRRASQSSSAAQPPTGYHWSYYVGFGWCCGTMHDTSDCERVGGKWFCRRAGSEIEQEFVPLLRVEEPDSVGEPMLPPDEEEDAPKPSERLYSSINAMFHGCCMACGCNDHDLERDGVKRKCGCCCHQRPEQPETEGEERERTTRVGSQSGRRSVRAPRANASAGNRGDSGG